MPLCSLMSGGTESDLSVRVLFRVLFPCPGVPGHYLRNSVVSEAVSLHFPTVVSTF